MENQELSLGKATLRVGAIVLASSLAFVGALCGLLLLVSMAVGGKPSSTDVSTTSVSPAVDGVKDTSRGTSPAGGTTSPDLGARKKPGTSI